MLRKVIIKNFRSLKHVSLDLQQVNLLIGPNNSGKSNLFKALEYIRAFHEGSAYGGEDFIRNTYMGRGAIKENNPISFTLVFEHPEINKFFYYQLEIFLLSLPPNFNLVETDLKFNYDIQNARANQFFGVSNSNNLQDFELRNLEFLHKNFEEYNFETNGLGIVFGNNYSFKENNTTKDFMYGVHKDVLDIYTMTSHSGPRFFIEQFNYPASVDLMLHFPELSKLIKGLQTYAPLPEFMKGPYPLEVDMHMREDGSNLVAFLDNMRDRHPEVVSKIIKDLNNCIDEFKDFRFEKVKLDKSNPYYEEYGNQTLKKIGLLDKNNMVYWSDELSDGVLYFLALLAIIHQPNPPKLLMLEEPEKGIHPRRIHEVIDYIFQLAENKGLQVIMSSHSTYVVDEFKDIPESIFIFEKEGAETQIKNLLADVIEPSDEKSKKEKLPKINYTESLGEHWAMGFLGGVPK